MARGQWRDYREPSAYSTASTANHPPELRPCQCEHPDHPATPTPLYDRGRFHVLGFVTGGCAPDVHRGRFPELLYICGSCYFAGHGPLFGRTGRG